MAASSSSSSDSPPPSVSNVSGPCWQNQNRAQRSYTDFIRLKLIGRGQVGRVYLAKDIHDNSIYAVKVLPKDEMVAKNRVRKLMLW